MVSFIEEYRQWLIEMGVSLDEPYLPKIVNSRPSGAGVGGSLGEL